MASLMKFEFPKLSIFDNFFAVNGADIDICALEIGERHRLGPGRG
jgi:hypothetical protein